MRNILLTVSYDGTPFYGWQKTEVGPSVEEHLQRAVEKIVQHEVELQAASRTDRGVHACEQQVNFFTEKDFDLNTFQLSLNSLLPKEIRILSVKKMKSAFHPTLDAIGKEYHYNICLGRVQLPHNRLFSWHVPQTLDLGKMRQAAKELEGTHDFSSFCTKVSYADAIRTLEKVRIFEEDGRLLVVLKGDNFLYKMARTVVGTLIYVGRGKLESVKEILKSGKRLEAGVTAPAHGLFLKKVYYC
ncbi:MAG: tRNA pseudouridine(38-40) synthase TruA [Chlamydiales bacterium]|nr:tRNA pseudouridine(38-40) synthase TruA [Chlamydiales bacterium]